jgi:hypothetical protein
MSFSNIEYYRILQEVKKGNCEVLKDIDVADDLLITYIFKQSDLCLKETIQYQLMNAEEREKNDLSKIFIYSDSGFGVFDNEKFCNVLTTEFGDIDSNIQRNFVNKDICVDELFKNQIIDEDIINSIIESEEINSVQFEHLVRS